jgi:hypothetical protein
MAGLRASLIVTALVLCFGSVLLPGVARGQASEMDRAYAAYLEADFDAARRHLGSAMARPEAGSAELARGHALAAVLASLDPSRGAEVASAIELALALDPSVEVPEGAPRAVSERFAEARRARAAVTPGVVVTSEGAGAGRAVTAAARDVPAPLVGSVHLRCGEREASDALTARLTVGADAVACAGEVRHPDGRSLFAGSLELTAEPSSDGEVGWIVLGVVLGAAAVGAAIAVGVAVGTSQDPGLGHPVVIGW